MRREKIANPIRWSIGPENEKIGKDVEKEFPFDPALQIVHIARKIIAKEAKSRGLSFIEYIKLQTREVSKTRA